jgi:TDG/mug DNA glycosylase family protein
MPDTEPTLPDLLRRGLDVVFVGINPSRFSVAQGHYFARTTNRFWPCFSRSTLSQPVRQALGVDRLNPAHDRLLPDFGIGFTDVVKRPTARAEEVTLAEFTSGAAQLADKLKDQAPRIACFHGITGFRHVHRVLAPDASQPILGPQPWRIGPSLLFVVPNPSPANAHATPASQTQWYDLIAKALASA